MSFLDDVIPGVVQQVLGVVGSAVTYRVLTEGTYNTSTGTASSSFADLTGVNASPLDYDTQRLGLRFSDFGVVVGDAGIVIAAADLTAAGAVADPKAGDRVVAYDSREWTVVGSLPVVTGSKAAAFELLLRR